MNKTRLYRVAVCVLMLASSTTICSFALSAPINCSLAKYDVEETICSHPSLTAQDKAISDRIDALRGVCPSLRPLLIQGQNYWLRERWDCRNVPGVFEKPEILATCLASRMEQRLHQLNNVPQSCDPQPLIVGYRFVDPVYILRYGDRYIGKTVSVFGSMELDSCRAPSTGKLTGHIVGSSSQRERYRAVFSSIPEGTRERLCAQHPASHWQGVVKQDRQGSYLLLSE